MCVCVFFVAIKDMLLMNCMFQVLNSWKEIGYPMNPDNSYLLMHDDACIFRRYAQNSSIKTCDMRATYQSWRARGNKTILASIHNIKTRRHHSCLYIRDVRLICRCATNPGKPQTINLGWQYCKGSIDFGPLLPASSSKSWISRIGSTLFYPINCIGKPVKLTGRFILKRALVL